MLEYTCKIYCYNAVNTSTCTELYLTGNSTQGNKLHWLQHLDMRQYLSAHIKTNNTDYRHASTNHVRLPGLEGREIDSRLPGPDTLWSFYCGWYMLSTAKSANIGFSCNYLPHPQTQITQFCLSRGPPSYQVASWSIEPFGHNRKLGGCAPLGEGDLGPHLTQCGQGHTLSVKKECHPNRGYNFSQLLSTLQNYFTAANITEFPTKPILHHHHKLSTLLHYVGKI